MAMKDILVYVDNSKQCAERLRVAVLLAQKQGGHLIGLHVRMTPRLPSFLQATYGAELSAAQHRYAKEVADNSKQVFDGIVGSSGVPYEWREVEGDLVEAVALHSRYADLVVLGQPDPDASETMGEKQLVDEVVFMAGRPVLVVPYIGSFPSVGERVLVAWNASREATRAVNDALPILEKSEWVNVLAVDPHGGNRGHGDVPGADICLHLARHDVNAVCQSIRAEDIDIGSVLLSRCADEDIDMMVMGAYGQSRIRAMVLGALTRHILQHMTVPVLLSH